MKYFTQSKSEISHFKKAPTNPRSTILASCVGAAASLLLAVNAHAGLIFQDTFDTTPTGATRTIVSQGTDVVSIQNTSGLGDGAYLNSTVAAGAGWSSYSTVSYKPTSAASSWAALTSSVTVGANTFLALNGGFDLFVRQDDVTTNNMWYRLLDMNNKSGTTGLRLILGSDGASGFKTEFLTGGTNVQYSGAGIGNVAGGTFSAFDKTGYQVVSSSQSSLFAAGTTSHIAYTFVTNPTTGLITMKLYAVAGTGEIDTTTTTPLTTMNIYADYTGMGGVALSATDWNLQSYPTGATATNPGNWGDGSSANYDTIRLYDSAPTVFAANVPEPATVGLVSGGLLLLGLCRRKAWLANK